MPGMRIEQYIVGPVMTNCYFAINDETNEVLVVDPGAAGKPLCNKIEEEGLKPAAVLLTHGHFDHAAAAEEVADHFGVKIYVHEAEEETMADPMINLSGAMGGNSKSYRGDVWVREGDVLDLAGFKIKVFHTPGHTAGGCCYYIEEAGVLFSGDSLFNGSIGRTDFPGGSEATLVRNIKEKLLKLPDETGVYPGHNETTTIQAEKIYNPFITGRW